MLHESTRGLKPQERAALLEFGGAMADSAGLPLEAQRLWRVLLADHPTAAEAPAALLDLARSLAGTRDGEEEAKQLLERLILEYPRSALVPQARRELVRLDGRSPAAESR